MRSTFSPTVGKQRVVVFLAVFALFATLAALASVP